MKNPFIERDIPTPYLTPAIAPADWESHREVCEEVLFTAGKIIVRGNTHTRSPKNHADNLLYHKPNHPVAVIQAKVDNHTNSDGMHKALIPADMFNTPFSYSSKGDGSMEHNSCHPPKMKFR